MKFQKEDNYIIIGAFFFFFISAIYITGFTEPYIVSITLTIAFGLLFSFITILIWKKMAVKLFNKWKNLKSEE